MPKNLWHDRAMKALVLPVLFLALCAPAFAQETNRDSDGSLQVAVPAPPLDPAVKTARELDRLFGALRAASADDAKQIEDKIWANWHQNPSPTAELLLRQASVALTDGALDTSETMLNEIVGTYPEYVEALDRRATLYFKLKRYDEALADIEQVLEMEPRHFGALAGRGVIYAAQGKIGTAKQSLEEALAINPHMETVKEALRQLAHDYPDI
jgi:tetratricopeptide (TPR) repeat protein